MATSGTYAFAPSAADLVINAFGRIRVRRPELTTGHMNDARMELNLLLQEWGVQGVNLWKVDLVEETLVAGQITYDCDPTTLCMLDTYISTGTGTDTNDRIITPVSRTDYAGFPNKQNTGVPTVYWFDRQITPVIYLWQPPDDAQTYTLKYYRMRQIMDVDVAGGQTAEIPIRFLEAFVTGLAYRLARIYAQDLEQLRGADYEKAWGLASRDDIEDVAISVLPQLGAYYR